PRPPHTSSPWGTGTSPTSAGRRICSRPTSAKLDIGRPLNHTESKLTNEPLCEGGSPRPSAPTFSLTWHERARIRLLSSARATSPLLAYLNRLGVVESRFRETCP